MNVLVACEFSGVVRRAFRARGHEAYSCDILPSDDNSPYHIQDDVLKHLDDGWDLMIAHPPCTYLCVTGNKWFLPEFRERFPNRLEQREEAIRFFKVLYEANIPKIAIENPLGIMSTVFRKPDQIIQPYYFGDGHSKKTCLWLKNLPKLNPTICLFPTPKFITFKSGKRMPEWYCEAKGTERASIRSKTFKGIAEAMASQWSELAAVQNGSAKLAIKE